MSPVSLAPRVWMDSDLRCYKSLPGGEGCEINCGCMDNCLNELSNCLRGDVPTQCINNYNVCLSRCPCEFTLPV